MEDWPPKDTNYDALLAEKKYYRVKFEEFTQADDEDKNGNSKAHEILGYTGVFRDASVSILYTCVGSNSFLEKYYWPEGQN